MSRDFEKVTGRKNTKNKEINYNTSNYFSKDSLDQKNCGPIFPDTLVRSLENLSSTM